MTFSVIIPVYNSVAYLRDCLGSLLCQSYNDYEIIIVDDESHDGSEMVCKEYAEHYSQVKFFRQKNAGPGAARNKGLDHACGEYVVFVDSDDWVDATFLSDYQENIKDWDIIYQGHWKEHNDGKSIKISGLKLCTTDIPAAIQYLWEHDCFGYTWMKCFRRSIIEQHHIRFDETVYFREDTIFTAEYFKYVKSVSVLPVANYHYRYVETSLQHTRFNVKEMLYVDDRIYMAFSMYFHDEAFREYTENWYLVNLHNGIKKSFARENQKTFSDAERKQLIEKCIGHRQQSHFTDYLYSQNRMLHHLLKALWASENKWLIFHGLKILMR